MVNIARNFLIMLSNLTQMCFKTVSKRAIQKAAETIGDLIVNKITEKIKRVSKNSQQSNSETVTNDNDREIPKERCISPEGKKTDDLRLL